MPGNDVYFCYLAGLVGDAARFAVFTRYLRSIDDDLECRTPSCADFDVINKGLYDLDRAGPLIRDVQEFRAWLTRGSGWAAFTPQSALELVPQWLQEGTEYVCVRRELNRASFFVELRVQSEISALNFSQLVGDAPEGDARVWFVQFMSNLVFGERPLPQL